MRWRRRFGLSMGWNRIMTSTASRLSIVQREIENLKFRLNPDPDTRAKLLKSRIADLEAELGDRRAGQGGGLARAGGNRGDS